MVVMSIYFMQFIIIMLQYWVFFFFTFYKCSTKLLNVIQLYTKGHDYLLHSEHSKMVKKKKKEF